MEALTKEPESFEQELKKFGLTELTKKEFKDALRAAKVMISVEGQTLCEDPVDLSAIIVKRTSERGSELYLHGFKRDEQNGLWSFQISSPLPQSFLDIYGADPFGDDSPILGTTLPDLCWRHAHGTTRQTELEVKTPRMEGAELGDLCWVLPSRFLDDVIEAVHVINGVFLPGILGESWIYGPFINRADA